MRDIQKASAAISSIVQPAKMNYEVQDIPV
jgi:hypothetical protein